MRRVVGLLAVCTLVLVVVAISSDTALAQCSMCKAVLSSTTDSKFIRNYNLGVLVLLVPPVTIFCSFFWALRRYRAADEQNSEADKTESHDARGSIS